MTLFEGKNLYIIMGIVIFCVCIVCIVCILYFIFNKKTDAIVAPLIDDTNNNNDTNNNINNTDPNNINNTDTNNITNTNTNNINNTDTNTNTAQKMISTNLITIANNLSLDTKYNYNFTTPQLAGYYLIIIELYSHKDNKQLIGGPGRGDVNTMCCFNLMTGFGGNPAYITNQSNTNYFILTSITNGFSVISTLGTDYKFYISYIKLDIPPLSQEITSTNLITIANNLSLDTKYNYNFTTPQLAGYYLIIIELYSHKDNKQLIGGPGRGDVNTMCCFNLMTGFGGNPAYITNQSNTNYFILTSITNGFSVISTLGTDYKFYISYIKLA